VYDRIAFLEAISGATSPWTDLDSEGYCAGGVSDARD
jgi:hypothetical protein